MNSTALITRQTIDELVNDRASLTLTNLALMRPDDLAKIQRDYYQRAFDQGIIATLQLLTTSHGEPGPKGTQRVWERMSGEPPMRTISVFTPLTGILEVTVNGHLVLSNRTPGREILIPGQWLASLGEYIAQQEAEARWRDQIDRSRAQMDAIEDFTADV